MSGHGEYYGAFRNHGGWEVWRYEGTTRVDFEKAFRCFRDADRYAIKLNREVANRAPL